MAGNKIIPQQIVSKDTLDQLYKASEYFANDTDNIQLSDLLLALNKELTPPLRLRENSPNSLILNIDAISVQNPETDVRRTILPIQDLIPTFTSGTVTFPAASGGNAVPSAGSNLVITISSGNYLKIGISLLSNGNISLVAGTQGASEAAATVPLLIASSCNIGFVVLHNTGGTIDNISGANIFQYINNDSGAISKAGLDAAGNLVTTDGTQAITNKDYYGGAASNTSRLTLPKDTTTNLNTLTRKEGTLVYDTTTDQVKYDDGTVLTALSDAATATSTAQGVVTSFSPVVQSNFTTITSADTTVTDGDGFETFYFSTGGTNRTLTLPTAADNDGRTLRIKKIDSGTGKVIIDGEGTETIEGALTYSLYGQYESAIVQCNGANWFLLETHPSSWTSWTPTGTWSTNVTYTGIWRKSHDIVQFQVMVECSGAVAGVGEAIDIPFTINTSGMIYTTEADRPPLLSGYGSVSDSGGSKFDIAVAYSTTTAVRLLSKVASATYVTLDNVVGDGSPITFSSGDRIIVSFSVPIVTT